MPTYTANRSPSVRRAPAACASVSSRIGDRPPIRAYRSLIACTNCGLVGRPPRTSSRYGSTSSRLPGPPYAISRTAIRSPAMHPLHHGADRLDRRLGEDSMPEVEDVAGPPVRPREHVPHLTLELGPWREQSDRVEVPLDGPRADPLPRRVERNAPVHADHVAAGAREVR